MTRPATVCFAAWSLATCGWKILRVRSAGVAPRPPVRQASLTPLLQQQPNRPLGSDVQKVSYEMHMQANMRAKEEKREGYAHHDVNHL